MTRLSVGAVFLGGGCVSWRRMGDSNPVSGRCALTRRLGMRLGGGWGIRTPEGFHPTRFPSVRHRPLGESSVGAGMRTCPRPPEMLPDFGSRSVHGRADASCCDIRSVSHHVVEQVEWMSAPRVAPSRPTPPGRKRSKGNRALAGARGVFFITAGEPGLRSCAQGCAGSFSSLGSIARATQEKRRHTLGSGFISAILLSTSTSGSWSPALRSCARICRPRRPNP